MGFTKIYKLTSNEVGAINSSYGSAPITGVGTIPVSFKTKSGTTYNSIADKIIIGVGSNANGFARAPLLGNLSASDVPSSASTSSSPYTFFELGSGSTAESEDDYCLSSPYINVTDYNISAVSTGLRTFDGDKVKLDTTCTISAHHDLTIREIGLFQRVLYSWTSPTSFIYSPGVLMYRKVLNTPLTISAGNSATIVLSIAAG